MNKTSLRTQVILPKSLRQQIDLARRASGESLAEYLRKGAEERLEKQQKQKEDLKKLASEVVGAVKKSSWDGIDVIKWQREMRRDRKILK